MKIAKVEITVLERELQKAKDSGSRGVIIGTYLLGHIIDDLNYSSGQTIEKLLTDKGEPIRTVDLDPDEVCPQCGLDLVIEQGFLPEGHWSVCCHPCEIGITGSGRNRTVDKFRKLVEGESP